MVYRKVVSSIDNKNQQTIHHKPYTIHKSEGLTLIELLVVISVIGILVTITTISFNILRVKGRDAARKQDLNSLKTALVLYYQDNKKYPGLPNKYYVFHSPSEWISGVDLTPTYIAKIPQDPIQPITSAGTCIGKPHVYCYYLQTNDNFILWAQLENEKDKEITKKPDSPCDLDPPAGTSLNYCLKSPSL